MEIGEGIQKVTLCFIVVEGQVLLIRKKRGLGAGKINGPGGKVEPGETPLAAAVRETVEETGVTPLGMSLRGELLFRFRGGQPFHCHIYLANSFAGNPRETEEALPLWYPASALPYEEMWGDDQHWLPFLLAGKSFRGWVDADGEEVVAHGIEIVPSGSGIALA